MDDVRFFTDSDVNSLGTVCDEGTYILERTGAAKAKSFSRTYDAAYIEKSLNGATRNELAKTMHAWSEKNAASYGFICRLGA